MQADKPKLLEELALKHQKAKTKAEKNAIFNEMELLFRDTLTAVIRSSYSEWHNQCSWEDLYQIALIGIEKTIILFDPKVGCYEGWLYTVATRKMLTEMKKLNQKKYKMAQSIDAIQKQDGNNTSISNILTKQERPILDRLSHEDEIKWLHEKLLSRLSDTERNIYVSYYVNGYEDYEEVARLAGITEKNQAKRLKLVDNALSRVRGKAKKILKEKGYLDFLTEKD
jgi:RNA polymerase sigma factor (sigma-70 family)